MPISAVARLPAGMAPRTSRPRRLSLPCTKWSCGGSSIHYDYQKRPRARHAAAANTHRHTRAPPVLDCAVRRHAIAGPPLCGGDRMDRSLPTANIMLLWLCAHSRRQSVGSMAQGAGGAHSLGRRGPRAAASSLTSCRVPRRYFSLLVEADQDVCDQKSANWRQRTARMLEPR